MSTRKAAGFGDYICSKCNHKWKSSESYENVGQKCKKCETIVLATIQRPLKKSKFSQKRTKEERHLKGCGPFFGEFKCNKCMKRWLSAYCWFDDDGVNKLPQKCKRCKLNVIPMKMRPLQHSESESTKPHQVHLCGKCKKLGYSCETLKRGFDDFFSRLRI